MNKRSISKDMVSTRNKSKVLLSSTPEHRGDSPSRDSDSICDSEAASPVPFLCTQDGAEGETDVIWNFYTPKSGNRATSRVKNSTPLSRKSKRSLQPKTIEKHVPRRQPVRSTQKKTELFQELLELNQNLHELIAKKQNNCVPEKPHSGSEDDIFNESLDCSPKCITRSNSRCLRKNVLSSNFGKPEPEIALDSDDSMNECLLKASQIVEEKFLQNDFIPAKKAKYDNHTRLKIDSKLKMDKDSMDVILNSIKLESPTVTKVKKCYSPCMNNDSFDSFVGNLNDSALEQLTQMPIKTELSKCKAAVKSKDWTVKELVMNDNSPSSKSFFGRYSSMPVSPSVQDLSKPSTSGMAFGRYSTMPYNNEAENSSAAGDSPIRCTPEEIKKKHQLAREKLMAKRLLPFTSSQQTQSLPSQLTQHPRKTLFTPKIASVASNLINNTPVNIVTFTKQTINNSVDLKQLIEKKRQEALMRLRRRQPQNK